MTALATAMACRCPPDSSATVWRTERIVVTESEVNVSMPRYVVDKLQMALNDRTKPLKGSKVLVLGLAYKKDVDDPRESPSFKLMELLQQRGAELSYNDPHIETLPAMRHYDVPHLSSEALTPEFLASQDCVVVATDHSAYDWNFIAGTPS